MEEEFNYVVARKSVEGYLSVYNIRSRQVQYGTTEDAEDTLKYVRKSSTNPPEDYAVYKIDLKPVVN